MFGVVDDEGFAGGGFDFCAFVVDGGVVSVVWSDVYVPIYGCSVVAGGDDFACFAHHDDAFGGHGGGVFAVGDAVGSFIFVAGVDPLA